MPPDRFCGGQPHLVPESVLSVFHFGVRATTPVSLLSLFLSAVLACPLTPAIDRQNKTSDTDNNQVLALFCDNTGGNCNRVFWPDRIQRLVTLDGLSVSKQRSEWQVCLRTDQDGCPGIFSSTPFTEWSFQREGLSPQYFLQTIDGAPPLGVLTISHRAEP